jgi:flagellar motor switch/type III secretory pathway protein FliN
MSNAVHNLRPDIEAIVAEPEATTTDRLESMPWLPCTVSLEVPVVRFTIADLLSLKVGEVLETACHQSGDLPLRVNDVLIGWTEFEVVGDRLAVRLTELA